MASSITGLKNAPLWSRAHKTKQKKTVLCTSDCEPAVRANCANMPFLLFLWRGLFFPFGLKAAGGEEKASDREKSSFFASRNWLALDKEPGKNRRNYRKKPSKTQMHFVYTHTCTHWRHAYYLCAPQFGAHKSPRRCQLYNLKLCRGTRRKVGG